MRWYDYGYLEEIVVRRDDNMLYKFKEGDFPRLNLRYMKDMLLLLVQKKLSNLNVDDRYDLGVALRMFTRRIVILDRVKDLRLGVESYWKKLNITRPEKTRSNISKLTPYKNPQGIIYQDRYRRNRLMRSDELYKFYDGTLSSVITRNHVKEILLKLNLPDQRSILTDSKVTPTKYEQMTKPYSPPTFIANCFISGMYKDGHGDSSTSDGFSQGTEEYYSAAKQTLFAPEEGGENR
nr:hypothetical protein [Tanacetum cinerariifolium]